MRRTRCESGVFFSTEFSISYFFPRERELHVFGDILFCERTMCVSSPRNKSEVGRRVALALHALQENPAGQPFPTTIGPRVVEARLEIGSDNRPRAVITLDAGEGLTLGPVQRCVICCNQTTAGPNEM